jgi:hypothetical protein
MKMNRRSTVRATLVIALGLVITVASTRLRADTATCGGATTTLPFTDVPGSNVFFCSIASAYFTGLTNGTTPTTFNPTDPVLRQNMAAFVSRTLDQSLRRGSRRAALNQYWTPTSADGLGSTTVGSYPNFVKSDGTDLWVANFGGASVSRVRASDGKLLETWTGATNAYAVVGSEGADIRDWVRKPRNALPDRPNATSGCSHDAAHLSRSTRPGHNFRRRANLDGNSGGSVSIVTLNPIGVVKSHRDSVPRWGFCMTAPISGLRMGEQSPGASSSSTQTAPSSKPSLWVTAPGFRFSTARTSGCPTARMAYMLFARRPGQCSLR